MSNVNIPQQRRRRRPRQFYSKGTQIIQDLQGNVFNKPQLDVPPKKTAHNLFYEEIQERKKELKGVIVSQANAITSRKWKKVKSNEKKMKKYSDLHEVKKQLYEEDLQRYQEDYVGKV